MPRPVHRLTITATTAILLLAASPAFAQGPPPVIEPAIGRLRVWLTGLLAGLATLALTVAGFRYVWAGGDPTQVEKAKTALRLAAGGYALAALAPNVVTLLGWFVGA